MTGTIKTLNTKGFGFIKDAKGVEFFFHRSAVASDVDFDTLREGDHVQFEEEDSNKGPRAANVTLS